MENVPGTRGRGRIVMLVDNGVHGDSRVQKTAQSAADAGWDVTLLGRSPNGVKQTWTLGLAEVCLLPTPLLLGQPASTHRRPWLRPLAYPPTGIAARRRQEVRARRADLDVQRAVVRIDMRAGRPVGFVDRKVLGLRTLANRARGKWVSLRTRELDHAQKARKRQAGPGARAAAAVTRAVQGDQSWRRLLPGLWDYELAYGPVIDGLRPDIIHANDYRMLGVGARAKARARAKGRDVKLVWDAHEFLPGVHPLDNARWLPGNIAHEREYAPYADAVLTVSDGLAEMLQQYHHLTETPTVVLNAPAIDANGSDVPSPADASTAGATPPSLRAMCGLGPGVPLVVYSGLAAEKRGLATMIDALPKLDGVHVALVVPKPEAPFMKQLRARADGLHVGDRVHVLPYVPHWQVVPFLSDADIGVIPIHHVPNHEIALITKFFEYSHARLPIVVSDVRTMSGTVAATGQGVVFTATDADDYARAVRAVLADPDSFRAAYEKPGLLDEWTWAAQARVLDSVYERLAGNAGGHGER